MLSSFKGFVARTKLTHRRRQMETGTFRFPDALRTSKQVLVCLPGELRELTALKPHLAEIKDLFKSATITLLAQPGLKIADIFPSRGFNILTPSDDQVSWTGLAKSSYLDFLKDYKFDVILDLNLGTSTFTSSILLHYPNALRIGRGNHLGRPYYNLEIKTRYLRDERNIYRSVLETLRVLKDGRPKAEKDKEPVAADLLIKRRNGVPKET